MAATLIETDRPESLNTFRINTNAIAALVANSIQTMEFVGSVGFLHEWNVAVSGGTALQPATVTWSKGTDAIKLDYIWGTTGGEDGNVTRIVLSYSSNSGSTWTVYKGSGLTNGYFTIAYDVDGNFASGTWS